IQMVRELKGASKKNNAPIWSRLAELALKPSSAKRTINVGQIDKFVKDNDVIVVPGKVLGTGNISHKITLCSFSMSTSSAKKVLQSGGKILSFSELIKNHPTGKGVVIIG
ncbi:MAG TPA: 50S ribosomal protein L18e, partial [Nitrosopumilaceae archaeon]|nr:50S ribosomal protein L18e [Nitrosopumilaceae archaeon]